MPISDIGDTSPVVYPVETLPWLKPSPWPQSSAGGSGPALGTNQRYDITALLRAIQANNGGWYERRPYDRLTGSYGGTPQTAQERSWITDYFNRTGALPTSSDAASYMTKAFGRQGGMDINAPLDYLDISTMGKLGFKRPSEYAEASRWGLPFGPHAGGNVPFNSIVTKTAEGQPYLRFNQADERARGMDTFNPDEFLPDIYPQRPKYEPPLKPIMNIDEYIKANPAGAYLASIEAKYKADKAKESQQVYEDIIAKVDTIMPNGKIIKANSPLKTASEQHAEALQALEQDYLNAKDVIQSGRWNVNKTFNPTPVSPESEARKQRLITEYKPKYAALDAAFAADKLTQAQYDTAFDKLEADLKAAIGQNAGTPPVDYNAQAQIAADKAKKAADAMKLLTANHQMNWWESYPEYKAQYDTLQTEYNTAKAEYDDIVSQAIAPKFSGLNIDRNYLNDWYNEYKTNALKQEPANRAAYDTSFNQQGGNWGQSGMVRGNPPQPPDPALIQQRQYRPEYDTFVSSLGNIGENSRIWLDQAYPELVATYQQYGQGKPFTGWVRDFLKSGGKLPQPPASTTLDSRRYAPPVRYR